LAVVDIDYHTAYHLSTRQTPIQAKNAEKTRVHDYLRHFKEDCHALPKDVRYLVTDAMLTTVNKSSPTAYWNAAITRLANCAVMRTCAIYLRDTKHYDGKLIIGDTSQSLRLCG
jgi:hypothetical protein